MAILLNSSHCSVFCRHDFTLSSQQMEFYYPCLRSGEPRLRQNPGPGEWSLDGGAWASDQQLVGRKETSPEDRFSAKSVNPSALMDSSPVGTWAGAEPL